MTIRIGIAGCGAHALARIVPLLEASTELALVAVWTRSAGTQAVLRARGIAGVCGDFAQFLGSDMDVVYVASPSGCHFEHTAAVLRSGRHAWVEKPLACTLDEARELVALAERGNLMLAEAFMFTWHAQAEAIRQTLAADLPGAPRLLQLTFCFPHLRADNFRYDPALGGGAWLDHACYLVKALHSYFPGAWHLLGGCLEHDGYAVDVRGAALLRRPADGVVASLNWGFGHSYVNELVLLGARGRMLVESAFTKPAARSCAITLEDSTGQRHMVAAAADNAFARMLDAFTRDLRQPASWAGLREELLAHAERFFALHALLRQGDIPTSPEAPDHGA